MAQWKEFGRRVGRSGDAARRVRRHRGAIWRLAARSEALEQRVLLFGQGSDAVTDGGVVALPEVAETTDAYACASSTIPSSILNAAALLPSIEMRGNYILTAVSNAGTLGTGYRTVPGLIYDPSGTGAFDPNTDYIAPLDPFEEFSIKVDGRITENNNNSYTSPAMLPIALENLAGTAGYANYVRWTGATARCRVTHDYYFDPQDQWINIKTTITAIDALKAVEFLRSIDPDPDVWSGGSTFTQNVRGYPGLPPENYVEATAPVSGRRIALYCGIPGIHNTMISRLWSTDPDTALAGINDGDGDYTIGMGFDIGDMEAGQTVELVYQYIFQMGELVIKHAPVAYDRSLSTDEDTAISDVVTATDVHGDTLMYSAVAQPSHGTLSLQTDGIFTYTPASKYFGPDSFTYRANDGKWDSNIATVSITVRPHKPTDLSLSPSSIPENQPSGTVVGTLSTTSRDADDTFTYSLVSGVGTSNASFSIVGDQLQSAASFDYEAKSSYSIRVRTTDSDGFFFEKVLTITVTNTNEVPTDIILINTLVAENQSSGTIVGPLASSDPDFGDALTCAYTLVTGTGDDDNASFTISSSQLLTAASFILADRSTYSVRLRTTDAGGLSFEKAIIIHVVSIALSNTTVPENQPNGTLIGTLSCSNADAFSSLTYSLAPGTGGEDNGGFAVVGNQLLTAGPLNYEGKNWYSIRIRSSNLGVVIYEAIYPIAITNENESPTNVLLSGSGVPEGQPIGTKVGRLSATDSDGDDTFTYTLVPGPGSDDNASFRITGNRLVTASTFNYIPGREYAVRIRATDAGVLSVEKELGIPILAVFEFGRVDGRSNKNVSIADSDGDVVTFKLSGGGMGSFWGNQVGLIDTTATSTLSISVKKGRNGDGLYHIGDITSDGLLKSISAKSVIESGEVLINSLARSAGKATASLTFRQISDANICVQGLPLASIAVSGDVTNSRIVTTGSIKKMSVATLLNSDILVGVAADCAEHFATTEDFVDTSAKLESLKVSGRKLPSSATHPADVAGSHISAPSVGTIALLNVPAGTDPLVHVLTDVGTLTVTQSKLTSTAMFGTGTWKKPGTRPAIWQVLGQ